MVLQQQKDAVMQKLQRGEQLTQNDYAILNPEAAAKTQFETMQLQKVLGAQPVSAAPASVVAAQESVAELAYSSEELKKGNIFSFLAYSGRKGDAKSFCDKIGCAVPANDSDVWRTSPKK
jgi:hypothetical protein